MNSVNRGKQIDTKNNIWCKQVIYYNKNQTSVRTFLIEPDKMIDHQSIKERIRTLKHTAVFIWAIVGISYILHLYQEVLKYPQCKS